MENRFSPHESISWRIEMYRRASPEFRPGAGANVECKNRNSTAIDRALSTPIPDEIAPNATRRGMIRTDPDLRGGGELTRNVGLYFADSDRPPADLGISHTLKGYDGAFYR